MAQPQPALNGGLQGLGEMLTKLWPREGNHAQEGLSGKRYGRWGVIPIGCDRRRWPEMRMRVSG